MDNQNLPPQAKDPSIQTERVDKAIEQNLGGNKLLLILKSKKVLISLGLGLLAVLVAGAVVYRNNQPVPVAYKLEPKNEPIPNSFIASKALDFLESQKDLQGRYYFGLDCLSATDCKNPGLDNRAGIYAMWGRYKFYKNHPSDADLKIINRDIDTYNSKTLTPTIQLDHWGCKLLYEMWQDEIFTSQQKDKIKNICNRSEPYPVPDYSQINSASESATFADMDAITRNRNASASGQLSATIKVRFVQYATSVSDFVARSIWMNNDRAYKAGLMHFRAASGLFRANPQFLKDTAPLLGIASLDLYKINNNPKFLEFAKYIFSQYASNPCTNIEQCINHALLGSALYSQNEDKNYLDSKEKAVYSLKYNHADIKNMPGFSYDKDGFYSKNTNNVYTVQQNGLAVGVLMTK